MFISYDDAIHESGFQDFNSALGRVRKSIYPITVIGYDRPHTTKHEDAISAAVQEALHRVALSAGAVIAAALHSPAAASRAVPSVAAPAIASAITNAFAAGFVQARQGVTITKADGDLNFSFDDKNSHTAEFLSNYKMNLIREIDINTRQAIHSVVSASVDAGEPPATMARNIRDTIGLTEAQSQWVRNYRTELESNHPGSLDRELRDKLSDGKVQRAIDNDSLLSENEVDKLVSGYRQRMLNMRATAISRTESIRAVEYGGFASMSEMVDELDDGTIVEKTWLSTADSRTRIDHQHMNGEKVIGLDQPFSNGLIIPHDESGDADQVINCRCTVQYRMIRSDE